MPKRNESNPARLRGRIERVYYAGPKFSAGRLLTPTGEEVQFAGNLFARENQPVVLLERGPPIPNTAVSSRSTGWSTTSNSIRRG